MVEVQELFNYAQTVNKHTVLENETPSAFGSLRWFFSLPESTEGELS